VSAYVIQLPPVLEVCCAGHDPARRFTDTSRLQINLSKIDAQNFAQVKEGRSRRYVNESPRHLERGLAILRSADSQLS